MTFVRRLSPVPWLRQHPVAADWSFAVGRASGPGGFGMPRSPSVWQSEIARGNNDANVLVLGAKVIDEPLAVEILEAWLRTPFKGAEHAKRIEMIAALERGESLL